MRSDEEDEEDELYGHEEEVVGGGLVLWARLTSMKEEGVDGDEEDAEGDEALEEVSDEEGSEDDMEADDDDEDEEEDDAEGDDDDEENNEEDDEDGSGEEAEDETAVMDYDDQEGSLLASQTSKAKVNQADLPPPPHIIRRSLFKPTFTTIPSSLSVEAIVGIPLPTPVHSLATSTCLSYLLAGGQDGFVRAYDFWASVNGSQPMTAQQRSVVGLGEGVNKAGVTRGWWVSEVEGITGGTLASRQEPVYSMACEEDALWALTGTQSGPINMFTLRHSPGNHIHTLKGHTNVVSCMTLLPGKKGFISGSWDGTVREWDLNTGQTVRTYPTHKAQLSSISLRPVGHAYSSCPSPGLQRKDGRDASPNLSISVGPDFFDKKDTNSTEKVDKKTVETTTIEEKVKPDDKEQGKGKENDKPGVDADVGMADSKSATSNNVDSLFGDDDAEGETATTSILPTNILTPPLTLSTKHKSTGLVLPGQRPIPAPASHTQSQPPSSSVPLFAPHIPSSANKQGAATTIPVLSRTSWDSYSEDVLMTSSMDGQIVLLDRRVPSYEGANTGVGRLLPGEKTPPWCMSACWLSDGNQVLAGRRNGTVEVWDVRKTSSSSAPNLLRTLRTPTESGSVSCVVPFPDGRHIATASQDNIRLWKVAELFHPEDSIKRSKARAPFKIIAGHHGGTVSSMIVDPTCRFLITASGDRGWGGESTKAVLIHEVKW
nr:transcriptional activator SPT8 [Cryptococcus depauperatus CBS 7841]